MKIAIHYDSLLNIGGAEKHVLLLAKQLHADVFTSGYNEKIFYKYSNKLKIIDLGNTLAKLFQPLGILFEAPFRHMFNYKAKTYDLNIYFGFTSIYGAKKTNKNIYYCLTPNRLIYDLKEYKLNQSNFFKKILLMLHIFLFKRLDQSVVKNRFEKILTQSKTVQERIDKYYSISSSIIPAPIKISDYKFYKLGDYYFTVGRLFPEKRIDLIINAFKNMTDKRLIVVGDGPEKANYLHSITNYPNIEIKSNIDDSTLQNLYSNCRAVIYMPIDEDYGLIPLEANASGKVCIAANEGGCRELIREGKTGYLIKPNEENIIKTVSKLNPSTLIKMKDDCLDNAKQYDITAISNIWKKYLNKEGYNYEIK